MATPDKETRSKCWAARDDYWKCLDKHNPEYNPQSGEPTPNECKNLRSIFESACPSTWVKHFDRKRTYERFKEQMAKGMDPITAKK